MFSSCFMVLRNFCWISASDFFLCRFIQKIWSGSFSKFGSFLTVEFSFVGDYPALNTGFNFFALRFLIILPSFINYLLIVPENCWFLPSSGRLFPGMKEVNKALHVGFFSGGGESETSLFTGIISGAGAVRISWRMGFAVEVRKTGRGGFR